MFFLDDLMLEEARMEIPKRNVSLWQRCASLPATLRRIAIVWRIRHEAARHSGISGVLVVGSVAWGPFIEVHAQSDLDMYVLGSLDGLAHFVAQSSLLRDSREMLIQLLMVLASHSQHLDMMSAKIRFAGLPLSTLFLVPQEAFQRITTQHLPGPEEGDFELHLRNLRPYYALQRKHAYAFNGQILVVEAPFDQTLALPPPCVSVTI